jgi:hypothetical protein
MSIQRFGVVDIDGLWLIREENHDDSELRYAGFDERKDVLNVIEEYYHHIPGTEYLAANPVVVPALTKLIESRPKATSDVVFNQLHISASGTQDLFQTLSAELRIMLLEMLGSRDVANLRLCSRSFSQLPQTFFRHLIAREMPWVWELHDTSESTLDRNIDWFALWTRLSASDGGACVDEKKRNLIEPDRAHAYDGKADEIKGLRNRRMIHRDISIILDMIASLDVVES